MNTKSFLPDENGILLFNYKWKIDKKDTIFTSLDEKIDKNL